MIAEHLNYSRIVSPTMLYLSAHDSQISKRPWAPAMRHSQSLLDGLRLLGIPACPRTPGQAVSKAYRGVR